MHYYLDDDWSSLSLYADQSNRKKSQIIRLLIEKLFILTHTTFQHFQCYVVYWTNGGGEARWKHPPSPSVALLRSCRYLQVVSRVSSCH